jgi:hypothetical protein
MAFDFDAARVGVERVVTSAGGWFRQLRVTGSRGQPRTLNATVMAPAARLDDVLSGLKALGHLVAESIQAEDVTDQVVDIRARLSNARNTERRLVELLRARTGKLTDVLEAEKEVGRVREEIERLDAQRQSLERRVAYAVLTVQIGEERRVSVDLGPRPLPSMFGDAFQTGLKTGLEGVLALGLLLVTIAPAAVIWTAVLGIPAWLIWRWKRGLGPGRDRSG